MHEASLPLTAALSGAACGAGFFGGLWWTIKHGLRSHQAALWFLGSTVLRSAGVIAGLVWIAPGDPIRVLAFIGGLCVSRVTANVLGRRWPPLLPPTQACLGICA